MAVSLRQGQRLALIKMPPEEAKALLWTIYDCLWPALDPDVEWNADLLSHIASLIEDALEGGG